MKPSRRNILDDFLRNPEGKTFEPLFEATKGLVYTICFRILRNRDDAQDAFQSTYCRLLVTAKDGPRPSQFDNWEDLVCRLAVRESDNLRGRLKRHRRREIAMEKPPLAPDSHPRADQVFEKRQLGRKIEGIIFTLPDRYRVPLLLHYFHGMSHAQIAAAMEVPVKTIYSRMSRALKKLGPRLSAAGVNGRIAGLVALVGLGDLLLPPSVLSAAVVFSRAQEAVAMGSSVAAGGAAASKLSTSSIGVIMKGKVAMIVGAAVVLLAGAVALQNFFSPASVGRSPTARSTDPVAGATPDTPERLEAGMAQRTPRETVTRIPTVLRGRVVLFGQGTAVGDAEVALRRSGEPLAGEKRALSNVDGAFEFRDVEPGEYRLVARMEKHVSAIVACRFPPAREETVTLHLREDRTLTVSVRSEDEGTPIAEANVLLRAGGSRREGLTDGEGRVQFSGLEPREWRVEVTHPERTRFRRMTHLESRAENSLEVALVRGGSIHGVITDTDGRPIATRLSYHFVGSSALKGEMWGEQSQADGSYRIQYLPLGVKIELSFGRKGFERVSQEVVLSRNHPVEELDVTLTVTATGSIAGIVTDSSNEPVARALVTYGQPGPPEDDPHTYTAADGTFRLDDLPLGKKYVFLTVQALGLAPKQLDAEPGPPDEPLRVDVKLEAGHWVKGSILDQDGDPIQGVRIRPYIDHNMIYQPLPQTAVTDSEGRFALEGLPASVIFSFHASGYGTDYSWQRLDLDRDDAEIKLRSTKGVVAGRFLDEESKKPVSGFRVKMAHSLEREPEEPKASGISTEREKVGVHFDSPDGSFKLGGLTVGAPLLLTFEAAGYPAQVFDRVMVEAEGDVHPVDFLVSKKSRAVRGKVFFTGGAPAVGAEVLVLVYRESERTEGMEVERNGVWSMLRNSAARSVRLLERSVTTDGDGQFTVKDLPDGHPIDLVVRGPWIAKTYVGRLEELPESEWDDLAVRVEAAASLLGHLNREAYPGVERVLLYSIDDPQFEVSQVVAANAATFHCDELPSGRYGVDILGAGRSIHNPARVLTRQRFHLEEGEAKEIRLGFDATFEVTGKVSVRGELLAGGAVILMAGNRARMFWRSTATDGEGRFSIPRVEPGSYHVVAFWKPAPQTSAILQSPNRTPIEVTEEDLQRDFEFPGACTVKGRIASFPPGFARWRAIALRGTTELADGTTVSRNVVIEDRPVFSFGDLPPGTYRLDYRAHNLRKTVRDDIVVSRGRPLVDLGAITID